MTNGWQDITLEPFHKMNDFFAGFLRVVHRHLIALFDRPCCTLDYAMLGIDCGVLGHVVRIFHSVPGFDGYRTRSFVDMSDSAFAFFDGLPAEVVDTSRSFGGAFLRV